MASTLVSWSVLWYALSLGPLLAVAGVVTERDTGVRTRHRQTRAGIAVSAASSLTVVLEEIGRAYERATGDRVVLNFAGSNTLARQIIAGAPVDLFVSANPAEMDRVDRAGLIQHGSRRDLLSNQLVVVTPDDRPDPPRTVRDLLDPAIRRIAIGNPEAVPAGVYARRYLESRNLWARIQQKVVPTRSVRAALAAVEAGHADAAFVYRTDSATTTTRAVLAFAVPVDEGPSIVYPTALVTEGGDPVGARRFLTFLVGSEARVIFERSGFIVIASKNRAVNDRLDGEE